MPILDILGSASTMLLWRSRQMTMPARPLARLRYAYLGAYALASKRLRPGQMPNAAPSSAAMAQGANGISAMAQMTT